MSYFARPAPRGAMVTASIILMLLVAACAPQGADFVQSMSFHPGTTTIGVFTTPDVINR